MEFRVTPGDDFELAYSYQIENGDEAMASVISGEDFNRLVIQFDAPAGVTSFDLVGPSGSDLLATYTNRNTKRVTGDDGLFIDWSDQSIPLVFKPDFTQGDDVRGGSGADTISGGLGNDYLRGNDGKDVIRGNQNNDSVIGRDGDDNLHGGGGADLLLGGRASDQLFGGRGNDRLFADSGDDILAGNAGRDVLSAGEGADVFIFSDGFDIDKIFEFKSPDIVDLSGLTGFDSMQDVRDHAHNHNDNVIISSGTDKLIIRDHQKADLSASDFLFAEI